MRAAQVPALVCSQRETAGRMFWIKSSEPLAALASKHISHQRMLTTLLAGYVLWLRTWQQVSHAQQEHTEAPSPSITSHVYSGPCAAWQVQLLGSPCSCSAVGCTLTSSKSGVLMSHRLTPSLARSLPTASGRWEGGRAGKGDGQSGRPSQHTEHRTRANRAPYSQQVVRSSGSTEGDLLRACHVHCNSPLGCASHAVQRPCPCHIVVVLPHASSPLSSSRPSSSGGPPTAPAIRRLTCRGGEYDPPARWTSPCQQCTARQRGG